MTADKAALLDLRDRLKAATGPDWDLSVALELTLVPGVTRCMNPRWRCRKGDTFYNPPAYTGSLDAAVGRVPEAVTAWEVRSHGGKTRFVAELSWLGAPGNHEEYATGHAATPALALCLARIEYELAKVTDHA